jgi:hypothetical protein
MYEHTRTNGAMLWINEKWVSNFAHGGQGDHTEPPEMQATNHLYWRLDCSMLREATASVVFGVWTLCSYFILADVINDVTILSQ